MKQFIIYLTIFICIQNVLIVNCSQLPLEMRKKKFGISGVFDNVSLIRMLGRKSDSNWDLIDFITSQQSDYVEVDWPEEQQLRRLNQLVMNYLNEQKVNVQSDNKFLDNLLQSGSCGGGCAFDGGCGNEYVSGCCWCNNGMNCCS